MDTFAVVVVRRGVKPSDISAAVRIAREEAATIHRIWRQEELKAGPLPADAGEGGEDKSQEGRDTRGKRIS